MRHDTEHNERLVIRFAPSECARNKVTPKIKWNVRFRWVRQRAIQNDSFEDADDNHGGGEREKPAAMRVEILF
jgi:hypothetical protein